MLFAGQNNLFHCFNILLSQKEKKKIQNKYVDTKLNLSDKCYEGILKYISRQCLTETQNEGVLCILGREN